RARPVRPRRGRARVRTRGRAARLRRRGPPARAGAARGVPPGARRLPGTVPVSDLPPVVDAAWLEARLGEPGLFVGGVRGPNAHARGHIPDSKPLVLGSPPPSSDEAVLAELAKEVGLRLRRHGVTGEERLVLVDRGDGVGAMPAAQMAELAGHPRVAVLIGGVAAGAGAVGARPGPRAEVQATLA